MTGIEPTKKIAQLFQEVPAVLKTAMHFLEVLDKPVPGFDLLDTTVTWKRTYRVIQSVSQFPQQLPNIKKISLPELRLPKFNRAEKVRLIGPTRFTLTGIISRGLKTKFAIDGQDIVIDSRTWVIGSLDVGCNAQGRGKISAQGTWIAEKICVEAKFN